MYKVLAAFSDPVNGGVYHEGEIYPRPGVDPTDERIAYLAGSGNKLGRSVVELVVTDGQPVPPKTTRKKRE